MAPVSAIERAFADQSSLKKRIYEVIDASPEHGPLFNDIAQLYLDSQALGLSSTAVTDDEPASKKRKLVNGSVAVHPRPKNVPRKPILEAKELSFTLPQRRKLNLGLAQYGEDMMAASTTFAVFTTIAATNDVDLEVPLDQFAYALRLPVPERSVKQYNFCLLPKPQSTLEPIIWTVGHGPLKSCQIGDPQLATIAPGPEDVLEKALSFALKRHGIDLTYPSEDEFASALRESHRKHETAYHVKAFRGSKDGYLFFLPNGIFFGFKKPLSFFAFDDIESISYTSVLQRTFNLNITFRSPPSNGAATTGDVSDTLEEVEFSMLDQADFPGIDGYVKTHGLQDASLAESRRAKKAQSGTNGRPAGQGPDSQGADGEEDTRTELEKAQQQLDDEEDDEEEDYDPGSDGDSDGSGDSDGDDDDDNYQKERQRLKGRDLVTEELGSEAEDVSITDEEANDQEQEDEIEDEEEEPAEDDVDEDEGDDEQVEDVQDHNNNDANGLQQHRGPVQTGFVPVSSETHQAAWGLGSGIPDPDDEDQL